MTSRSMPLAFAAAMLVGMLAAADAGPRDPRRSGGSPTARRTSASPNPAVSAVWPEARSSSGRASARHAQPTACDRDHWATRFRLGGEGSVALCGRSGLHPQVDGEGRSAADQAPGRRGAVLVPTGTASSSAPAPRARSSAACVGTETAMGATCKAIRAGTMARGVYLFDAGSGTNMLALAETWRRAHTHIHGWMIQGTYDWTGEFAASTSRAGTEAESGSRSPLCEAAT